MVDVKIDQANHRSHCSYEESNGVCKYDGYGAESHCQQCVERAVRARELLRFIEHAHNCDWLQVNWNKGPCDCGLHALLAKMASDELAALGKINPDLVADFTRSRRS